jgi:hypothetical protein
MFGFDVHTGLVGHAVNFDLEGDHGHANLLAIFKGEVGSAVCYDFHIYLVGFLNRWQEKSRPLRSMIFLISLKFYLIQPAKYICIEKILQMSIFLAVAFVRGK